MDHESHTDNQRRRGRDDREAREQIPSRAAPRDVRTMRRRSNSPYAGPTDTTADHSRYLSEMPTSHSATPKLPSLSSNDSEMPGAWSADRTITSYTTIMADLPFRAAPEAHRFPQEVSSLPQMPDTPIIRPTAPMAISSPYKRVTAVSLARMESDANTPLTPERAAFVIANRAGRAHARTTKELSRKPMATPQLLWAPTPEEITKTIEDLRNHRESIAKLTSNRHSTKARMNRILAQNEQMKVPRPDKTIARSPAKTSLARCPAAHSRVPPSSPVERFSELFTPVPNFTTVATPPSHLTFMQQIELDEVGIVSEDDNDEEWTQIDRDDEDEWDVVEKVSHRGRMK